MVLLERFSNFMETDQLQNGFKKKSSRYHELFVLRQQFLSLWYNDKVIKQLTLLRIIFISSDILSFVGTATQHASQH